MCTSIDKLNDCGTSDLKKKTKLLTFHIAVSVLSISRNYASIFAGNTSLECFNTCSADIPIILLRNLMSYVNSSESGFCACPYVNVSGPTLMRGIC